jgi:hypothetical protein
MKVHWDVNDDGVMELLVLTGFSVALLPDALVAVQLRGMPGDVLQGRRLQIGMSAEVVRDLAAGLLKTVDLTGNTPGSGGWIDSPDDHHRRASMLRCGGELGANGTENDLVGYSSPTCPEDQAARPRLQCSACSARWFVFSSIWEMQHISRFALRQLDGPLRDQIVQVIGESFADRFRRSTVDLQTRAVSQANALISAVHHDEVHRPRPSGINRRHQDSLAAPASVLATCFNNHVQFSHIVRPEGRPR